MQGTTLLIVDDDELWRGCTAEYFSSLEYRAYTADTCAAGIELADELRPDYVLLDYHLADGDAAQVCAHIRSSEKLKKTFILVVSGDDTRMESAYDECQADHFILKTTQYKTMHLMMQCLKRRVSWSRGMIEKGDLRLEAVTGDVYKNAKQLRRFSADRFNLLFLLVEKSPAIVTEEDIARRVYDSELTQEKSTSINILIHRLRRDLAPELAARIRNRRGSGWVYLPPA